MLQEGDELADVRVAQYGREGLRQYQRQGETGTRHTPGANLSYSFRSKQNDLVS